MRNPVIAGERVYLRPLEVDDAKLLAEASHYETDTFMHRGRDLLSPISLELFIRGLYERHPIDEIHLAVCLTENDDFIGLVNLEFIDLINSVAETGIWLQSPKYRNKGYGTEAKHLILEYAFHRLHLERIVAFVFEPNTRSAAALTRQGYHPAGRLKWQGTKDGRLQDTLLFDLLPEEWLIARDRWRVEQRERKQMQAQKRSTTPAQSAG